MRALEYRVIRHQVDNRLKVKTVDIAIYGASQRINRTMLREAANRLAKHRRQAENGMTHLLTCSNLHRYREAS